MRHSQSPARGGWILLGLMLISAAAAFVLIKRRPHRAVRSSPHVAALALLSEPVDAAPVPVTARRRQRAPLVGVGVVAVIVLVITFGFAHRGGGGRSVIADNIQLADGLTAIPEDPALWARTSQLTSQLTPAVATVESIEQPEDVEVVADVPTEDQHTDEHPEESTAPWWEQESAPVEETVVSVEAPAALNQASYAAPAGDTGPVASTGLGWPLVAPLTSIFGPAHPLGIDFGAGEGTPVRAAGAGQVRAAAYNDAYGYFVVIDHAGGYTSVYAHFMAPASVRAGQAVARGAVIGLVGTTGKSTGPHLHFEVHRFNRLIDPLSALPQIPLVITPLALRGPDTAPSSTQAPTAVESVVSTPVMVQSPVATAVATLPPLIRTAPPPAEATTEAPEPVTPTAAPTLPPVITATVQPVATAIATAVAIATASPTPRPLPPTVTAVAPPPVATPPIATPPIATPPIATPPRPAPFATPPPTVVETPVAVPATREPEEYR